MKTTTKHNSISKLTTTRKQRARNHTISNLVESPRVESKVGSSVITFGKKEKAKQLSVVSSARKPKVTKKHLIGKKLNTQKIYTPNSDKVLKENKKLLEKRKHLPDITDRNSVKEILRISKRILIESKLRYNI